MSFGKRKLGKADDGLSPINSIYEHPSPAIRSSRPDTTSISRLLVILVAGIVMLAGISALFFIHPGRNETIEVEASLIDGSMFSASAQGLVVQMCVEEGMLTATRGEHAGDDQKPRVARICECTVGGVVGQLSPLQMRMLYVDYRTKLRATLAAIDRTGEHISTGAMPKLDARDGAPIALVTAASFQSHWREARGLLSQQSARCQS